MIKKYLPAIIGWLILLALSFLLACVSNQLRSVNGWASFHVVLLLSTGLLYLGWWLLRNEQAPKWLGYLLITAAVLRLALGALWFLALPIWGYTDNEVQQAGYVMEDAYNREAAAWRLAHTDKPLIKAFQGFTTFDIFGGLLFLDAFIYRYIAVDVHQPLLTIIPAAFASALMVVFTWAFARRAWGDKVATLSAVLAAFYPEAMLLGSTQMREAYTMTLVVVSLYTLLRFWQARNTKNLLLALLPILVAFAISPPVGGLMLTMYLLASLVMIDLRVFRNWRTWVIFASLVGGGVMILSATNFFDFSALLDSGEFQAYASRHASGWVYRQFTIMPGWAQFPFLITYGVFRPLLPSALIASGLPLWKAVGITRALGWTSVLVLLLYASFLTLRGKGQRGLVAALLLVSWGTILVASFRGGGDLWDNPRYRVTFAGVQVALAAWAWYKQREIADPWLRRAFGAAVAMVFWFVIWYLRRYIGLEWGLVEIQDVAGLGLATAILYWIWDWATYTKIPEDLTKPHLAVVDAHLAPRHTISINDPV